MPFVERDADTAAVKGLYASLQPGYAEEWREDNDPDVIAYLRPPVTEPPRDALAELDALKAALVRKNVVTDKEVEAESAAV